jgi:uncharacterized membrane protein
LDHHEQHHQHHEKERQEKIKHEKEWEHQHEKDVRQIHPAWFVALGVLLIILMVATWTIFF